MRLLPRGTDFSSLATSLSLAIANYKPIPQLPSASGSQGSIASSDGARMQVSGSKLGHGSSFEVNTKPSKNQDGTLPSILYIPKTEKKLGGGNGAHAFVGGGATLGPGNCPVQDPYTPNGGWDALPAPVFPPFDAPKANVMRYRQQQGVDLGAWFVQEAWMTPSLFDCATGGKSAEYDVLDGFGQSPDGVANATSYMQRHWDTFIVEDDFKRMADMGINTVRLPIGYWSVGPYFTRDSPFQAYQQVYELSWRYVARAINWAAKYDIGVLVDLHGAYGSQNGQAHSGLSDGNIEFYKDQNMNLTTELLVWLANEVSDVTNVIGIQLLNEPQDRPSLWPWFDSTMDAMRAASPAASTVPLYFHDAFNLEKGAAFVSKRSDFVVQDHHSYYVYTKQDTSLSAKGHIQAIQGPISNWLQNSSDIARRNLIIGEWSCALNPASLQGSSSPKRDQKNFCESQRAVYAQAAAGWTFWSWKMENCEDNSGWCFQSAVGSNLPSYFDAWDLPRNLNAKSSNASSALSLAVKAIEAIQMPLSQSNGGSSSASAGGTSASAKAGVASAHKAISEGARVGAVQKPIGANAKVSSASTSTPTSSAPSYAHDGARVGMIVKHPAQQKRQPLGWHRFAGHGSIASRAGAKAREEQAKPGHSSKFPQAQRLASASSGISTLATDRGFADGFLTAKIFAAVNSNGLSRLGFAQQYMHDSFQAHRKAGTLGNLDSDSSSYATSFRAGLAQGETAVRSAVQGALRQSS